MVQKFHRENIKEDLLPVIVIFSIFIFVIVYAIYIDNITSDILQNPEK